MRERDIERHLVEQVEALGGEAFKFKSPSNRGVSDRIVMLPHGQLWFVEVKAPGKKPAKLQTLFFKVCDELCQAWVVLDSKEGVDAWIRSVTTR